MTPSSSPQEFPLLHNTNRTVAVYYRIVLKNEMQLAACGMNAGYFYRFFISSTIDPKALSEELTLGLSSVAFDEETR